MPGRPRKPTVLKILHGEKRPCRLNKNEPKPEVKVTACPYYLHGIVRSEYKRLAKELAKLGLMSELYQNSLAMYCQSFARWLQSEILLEEKGVLYVNKSGMVVKSPVLRVADQAFDQVCGIAKEFGFTPSAMAHLSVQPKEEENEMAEFLRRAAERRRQRVNESAPL
jgi:P27 family predicted phage terminase small subunit